MTEEESFKAGWKAGYSDGGEHDCRMFTPTAQIAWNTFVFNRLRSNGLCGVLMTNGHCQKRRYHVGACGPVGI